MTLATLSDILPPANAEGRAVAGLVCLGWEDASAYALAAADEGAPAILQVGPGARAHMPLSVWAPMLRHLAEAAPVPLVVHLDHGASLDEVRAAIDAGFTSVMIDGSRLPYAQNVALTRAAVELAHARGVPCEGEIGFVGYASGERAAVTSNPTDPDEAARFATETGVDALAVSVGNVHLKTEANAAIDWAALHAIEAAVDVPLVLHGASGIAPADRRRIARDTGVAKLNVGTELRRAFGAALRDALAADPDRFDRVAILRDTIEPVRAAARGVIRDLHAPEPTGD